MTTTQKYRVTRFDRKWETACTRICLRGSLENSAQSDCKASQDDLRLSQKAFAQAVG